MIFQRIKEGILSLKKVFAKTRSLFGEKLRSLFGQKIDDQALEQLYALFYEADLGPETPQKS